MSSTPKIYLPDAVNDTAARRRATAARRAALADRLRAAAGNDDLAWVVVPICHLEDGAELYSTALAAVAREISQMVAGTAPSIHVLQMGVGMGVHLNILMPKKAVPDRSKLDAGTHWQPIWDLEGVMLYLAGPADQRASPRKHLGTGRHFAAPWADRQRAAVDWQSAHDLAALHGGQLPRMSWTLNLPQIGDTRLVNSLRDSDVLPPLQAAQSALFAGATQAAAAQAAGISTRQLRRWLKAGLIVPPSASDSASLTPRPDAEAEANKEAPDMTRPRRTYRPTTAWQATEVLL